MRRVTVPQQLPPPKTDRALLDRLLENSKRELTPEEIEAQRKSWVRGMMPTGDPQFD